MAYGGRGGQHLFLVKDVDKVRRVLGRFGGGSLVTSTGFPGSFDTTEGIFISKNSLRSLDGRYSSAGGRGQ